MHEINDNLNNIIPSDVKPSGFSIKVSAPGKIILHGEHSVVYGKLALAAALGLRSTFQLVEIQHNNEFIVKLPVDFFFRYNLQEIKNLLEVPLSVDNSKNFNWEYPENIHHGNLLNKVDKFVNDSIENKTINSQQLTSQRAIFYLIFGILGSVNIRLSSIFIHSQTQLEIGAGVGSSASFLVSLAALLVQYVKIRKITDDFSKSTYKPSSWAVNVEKFNEKELEIICKWAFNAEKIFHGTPSGIDTTVCTYGSLVEFRKGSPLKLTPMKATIHILLINSKVQRETKTLVGKVAQLHRDYPRVIANVFEAMEEISLTAIKKLKTLSAAEEENKAENWQNQINKSYDDLGVLTSINQNLLASLGVSHPQLDRIISALSECGLRGKLTGAGGGGYAIALVPPRFDNSLLESVQEQLTSKGFEVSYVTIGGSGVTID